MRLERRGPKGDEKYYLVKDIRVGSRTARLKKYLGRKAPASRELRAYEKKFALGIELKAANAAGRLATTAYRAQYLTNEHIAALEELRYLTKLTADVLTASENRAYELRSEVEYVRGTTAIEGNTMTLAETRDLLLHGLIPGSRTLREVNEVQNYKRVKAYRDYFRGRVTIRFMRHLHSLILHNIDEESAGYFRRTDDIGIQGLDIRLCPAMLIEEELDGIASEYYRRIKDRYHPFEQAILYHYRFETIHPFADGNGRVGREILNYQLARKGYPRLLLSGTVRAGYLEALRQGNEENYRDMVSMFAELELGQRNAILKANIRRILADGA